MATEILRVNPCFRKQRRPFAKPVGGFVAFQRSALRFRERIRGRTIQSLAAQAEIFVNEWQTGDIERTKPAGFREVWKIQHFSMETIIEQPPVERQQPFAHRFQFLSRP